LRRDASALASTFTIEASLADVCHRAHAVKLIITKISIRVALTYSDASATGYLAAVAIRQRHA